MKVKKNVAAQTAAGGNTISDWSIIAGTVIFLCCLFLLVVWIMKNV